MENKHRVSDWLLAEKFPFFQILVYIQLADWSKLVKFNLILQFAGYYEVHLCSYSWFAILEKNFKSTNIPCFHICEMYRTLRASMVTILSFAPQIPVFRAPFSQSIRKCVHTSAPSGGYSARFKGSRRRGGHHTRESGRVKIDKFVKHLAHDGALVIRAPFVTEIRGSHFDFENNIDKFKNSEMTRFYRGQYYPGQNLYRTVVSPGSENLEATSSEDIEARTKEEIRKVSEALQEHISRDEKRQRREDQCAYSGAENDPLLEQNRTSPLHVTLHGRSDLKANSYSVVNDRLQQHVRFSLPNPSLIACDKPFIITDLCVPDRF